MEKDIKKMVDKSQKRCEEIGLSRGMVFSRKIIEGVELEDELEKSRELILAAIPFIDQLYKFVKGSDFFIILTDANGCILNIVGDEKILDDAFKFKMIPGAYMDDDNIGTNAMGLVINEKIPVQISGDDHFIEAYHKWTCSAAPIIDQSGNLMGVINLTGYTQDVHPHTLGMVVAAAFSIERIITDGTIRKRRKMHERISECRAVYNFDKIVSEDPKFLDTIEYAKKISRSKSTILITGETGTGKEVFAQSIHNYSERANMPFVAVNCGAIPANLIESELFGYEEGAFTGAKKGGSEGKFQSADGGTIFLDEIGEMPIDMQVRLLRVIEEGVVTRIGGIKPIPVDVRIIAATNRELTDAVESGKFRKDLFYRLNVLPVYLLPLKERRRDIMLLVDYYMNKISRKLGKNKVDFNESEKEKLVNYSWPGNIRQLQNVVELVINTGKLPGELFGVQTEARYVAEKMEEEKIHNLHEVEKEYIERALEECGYNISRTAKKLGIARNTLYKKIKDFSIRCS
ncbi:MAG: acoR [Firmicutes bacterium]|nr:acoR [Bacillota bacterium]